VKKLICFSIGLCLFSLGEVASVWSQVQPDTFSNTPRNLSGYYLSPDYSTSLEGRLLMKVNVWGEVNKPGIYEVPDQTDLVSLVSAAGGPTDAAKLSKVKLVRNHFQKKQVIKVDLKKYMEDGNYTDIPKIYPGDTVVIPKSKFSNVAKYMTFIYNVAVIAATVKIYTN